MKKLRFEPIEPPLLRAMNSKTGENSGKDKPPVKKPTSKGKPA